MSRLKSLVLISAAFMFIISCTKTIEPPALGDHTEYQFNTPPPPVDPPPAKNTLVLSLGAKWGDIILGGPKNTIYVRNDNKVFNIYKPNDEGIYGTGTPFPGDPWDASANAFYMGVAQGAETMMVTNVPPAGLFRFDINSQGFLDVHPTTNAADPWPTNFGFWYGDGWDKYDIIAFKDKFVFQIDHSQDEALLRSSFADFTDDWSTWNRPATLVRDATGKSFKDYRAALSVGDSLLIVTSGGDMMAFAVDDNGDLDAGTKVGENWKIYQRIFAIGRNVFGLDSKGDIYRYTVDLSKTDNDAVEP